MAKSMGKKVHCVVLTVSTVKLCSTRLNTLLASPAGRSPTIAGPPAIAGVARGRGQCMFL
jgi:hypothetical protein